MKINTIQYFVTLTECESINEAAKKLHVSQPSLSKSLILLEEELGAKLFVRSNSGIALTEIGKSILPEARLMLEYYKRWKQLANEVSLNSINIYSHGSLVDFLIPDIIMSLKEDYPEIGIEQVPSPAPERFITKDTRNPALALTICTRKDESLFQTYVEMQGNEPITLFKGCYECLVNRESPLAHKKTVSMADLKNLCLVTPNFDNLLVESTFINLILRDLLVAMSPKQYMQVASLALVINMLRKHNYTYAISYYPALLRYSGVETGELVHVPFDYEFPSSEVCLFYSKKAARQHPVLQNLISTIREESKRFLLQAQ